MTNIVYVIKKHILVRLFLAITLCVVTAMLLGSGLKTQPANSLGNFDQPIIVKNSAVASPDNALALSNQAAPAGMAASAQPAVASSLDKALRSMGSANQSAAASTGGAGAKAGDKAAADKAADPKSVAETVATPAATPKK